MIYCVIPRELVDDLYDKMVDYYDDNPNVTVIVERRDGPDRREGEDTTEENKNRRITRDRRRAHPGRFPKTDVPDDTAATD
jgi:hypothetical protein